MSKRNFGMLGPSWLSDQMVSPIFRHGFDCILVSERCGTPMQQLRAQRRLDRSSSVRSAKRCRELENRKTAKPQSQEGKKE
jgi:hypothetical protein